MKQKKETKIERQKVQVRDVPYIYIDNNILKGTLEEVSKNIFNLKNKLKEAYNTREKSSKENFKKDKTPYFTPFNEYKYINLDIDTSFSTIDFEIVVYRDETDEELSNRIEANKNRSIAAKKTAETRKLAQDKREKTLLENLKKKYGE